MSCWRGAALLMGSVLLMAVLFCPASASTSGEETCSCAGAP